MVIQMLFSFLANTTVEYQNVVIDIFVEIIKINSCNRETSNFGMEF